MGLNAKVLNFGNKLTRVVSGHSTPEKVPPVLNEQATWWIPEPAGMPWKRDKSFVHAMNQTSIPRAPSQ
jgi:hypothetical protein